ncbi:MAG: ABC transporter permease, partial [Candidatus Latescibacteria bacterium]|nr:ABC transporter permease [Candidatus Latescibacterota bacterium]
MLRLVIRKEILSNLSSPTFIITFVLCSGLILLSIYTGLRNYSDQVTEYRLTQSINRELLGEQTNYRDVGRNGVQLSKPPKVLSILVSGLENSLGRHATVSLYSPHPKMTSSKIEGNPIFALFGSLDLMFLTKTVLALLAILFTYNAISGDKESGTLRLTLSYPVPRDTVILGKILGGFICLMIPIVLPILFAAALLTAFPDVQMAGQDWVRVGLILASFVLYLTLFFTLGMFVSSRTTRSSISFLVLLFVWVVCTLVIPKGSVIMAGQFIPVPSIHEHRLRLNQMMRSLHRDLRPEMMETYKKFPYPKRKKIPSGAPKAERDQIMAEWKKQRDEVRKKQQEAIQELFEKMRVEREAGEARMEQEYANKQRALAALAVSLSRISPAAAMTYATMTIAGTGI